METETSDNINDYLVEIESKNITELNISNSVDENIQDYLNSNSIIETNELQEKVINFNDFMKKIILKIENNTQVENNIQDEYINNQISNKTDILPEYTIINNLESNNLDDNCNDSDNADNADNADNSDDSDDSDDNNFLEKIFNSQQIKEIEYKDIEIENNLEPDNLEPIDFEEFKKENIDNIDNNDNILELDNMVDKLYEKYEKYITENPNEEKNEKEDNKDEQNFQSVNYSNNNIIIYDDEKVLNNQENIVEINQVDNNEDIEDIKNLIKKMDLDELNELNQLNKLNEFNEFNELNELNQSEKNSDIVNEIETPNLISESKISKIIQDDSELDEDTDTDQCIKNRYEEQKYNLINTMLINLGIFKNLNLPNINLSDIIQIVESIEEKNIENKNI
jgi:hypothetical protein